METHPFFNVSRVFHHIEELCYPRRVGTPGERRAARYILREFAGLGLERKRETFPVALGPSEIGGRLVFALCVALVLLGVVLVPSRPAMAAACWGLAGGLVNSPWRVAGSLGRRWPARTTSQNLLATLSGTTEEAPARVIFMAHYDTKSQLLPTGVRVALVSMAVSLCGLLALLGLAAAVGSPGALAQVHFRALAGVVVLLLAGLIANVTGNRSPGALDNGSGVGTLLELARSWRPTDEAPVEVYWVASGSEEVGSDGACAFLKTYESWWRQKPTLLINLESVGAGAHLRLAGEERSVRLAGEVADRLGLPHSRFGVLGAGMDHEPFAARDLSALSILGDVVRHSLVMHTPGDHMGLIQRPALLRAALLAGHLAWAWAALHQPADAATDPEAVGVGVA
ncbi:MAG TPA: M28 family peptidase [Isosphaeraceae bacterium]